MILILYDGVRFCIFSSDSRQGIKCLQNYNLRKFIVSSKGIVILWIELTCSWLSCHYFADDHNRVLLKETASATGSDYINASYVVSLSPKILFRNGLSSFWLSTEKLKPEWTPWCGETCVSDRVTVGFGWSLKSCVQSGVESNQAFTLVLGLVLLWLFERSNW